MYYPYPRTTLAQFHYALNDMIVRAIRHYADALHNIAIKAEDPDGDWDDTDHEPGDAPWNWTLGVHKSLQRWLNQMASRQWTKEQITRTIAEGKPYPAPNKVHPENPAIRYELDGKFVVRDEVTKEILQVSKDGPFYPNEI